MANALKIDSNQTGLRYQKELSIGEYDPDGYWMPLEPNSYKDFGGTIKTVARNPINQSRQLKKGVTTDLDSVAGFSTDLTQTNLADIMQGFMFAALRKKAEFTGVITAATGPNTYSATGIHTGMYVGDLVFMSGFADASNNGLKRVTVVASNVLTVAETLVAETGPATSKLVKVGFQFASGDADILTTGAYAKLTCTAKDATQFSLLPGEWIFIGGDDAAAVTGNQFATAANNGFKRVKSVVAGSITIDKSTSDMVTEALGDRVIRIFFGRVLKNESDPALIVRTTYQLERTLGSPTIGGTIQAEYSVGSVANEFMLNIPTADKVMADLDFVCTDSEQAAAVKVTSLGAPGRPDIVESDAFNTSSDVSRVRLSVIDAADEAPAALFAFVTDLKLTINNGAVPNKAVAVLGAFDVSIGSFKVEGSLTAYFTDIASIQAVRDNADVTMDIHLAKANAGISIDIPLCSLGDARAKVEQDAPITIPITQMAAAGAKYDANMNHTLLICFFDYLPTLAM